MTGTDAAPGGLDHTGSPQQADEAGLAPDRAALAPDVAGLTPDRAAGTAVPPGSGWPDDPATATTPVAHGADEVTELARGAATMAELAARQSVCRACPRLVSWREQVAAHKRRSFQAERYWGRPVPGWGGERPRILIIGLAPAAHG